MMENYPNSIKLFGTDNQICRDDAPSRDDCYQQTVITYYILLIFFIFLALMGFVNIYLAQKIRKFSKPIVTFYLISEIVIAFRIILFADPIFNWNYVSYVVILISLPSYLYLLVGLS